MKNHPSVGVQIPDLFLPSPSLDPQKWAVIACDQYTSQPEYWKQVAELVGKAPSALNLIFPEAYLGKTDEDARIQSIHQSMQDYLKAGYLIPHEGMIYVEREIEGKTRRGLVLALDLDRYDFNSCSSALIRATEFTILDRLPPRIRIRDHALLELPHVLMLIDDPEDCVIGPIEKSKSLMQVAYDFDLMQNSGHLCGRFIEDASLVTGIVNGLEHLANPQVFERKYNLPAGTPVFLFASGDGNHSLATAKSCWEKIKGTVPLDHPARFALVEVVNLHDASLVFEPIHRLLFDLQGDPMAAMQEYFKDRMEITSMPNSASMMDTVNHYAGPDHTFGFVRKDEWWVVTIHKPDLNLSVGTLQVFLDVWLKNTPGTQIDFVHGDETICALAQKTAHAGFFLAAMPKNGFFKTVIMDGSLPRKAFSMGEAFEKRFYFESRCIIP